LDDAATTHNPGGVLLHGMGGVRGRRHGAARGASSGAISLCAAAGGGESVTCKASRHGEVNIREEV
jgi:hypothetical protein